MSSRTSQRNAQPPEPVQQGDGLLYHPSIDAQPGAVRDAAAGDDGPNALACTSARYLGHRFDSDRRLHPESPAPKGFPACPRLTVRSNASLGWLRCAYGAPNELSSLPQAGIDHVAVQARRHGSGSVPQHPLDDLRVRCAASQREAGVCWEVVDSHGGNTGRRLGGPSANPALPVRLAQWAASGAANSQEPDPLARAHRSTIRTNAGTSGTVRAPVVLQRVHVQGTTAVMPMTGKPQAGACRLVRDD